MNRIKQRLVDRLQKSKFFATQNILACISQERPNTTGIRVNNTSLGSFGAHAFKPDLACRSVGIHTKTAQNLDTRRV